MPHNPHSIQVRRLVMMSLFAAWLAMVATSQAIVFHPLISTNPVTGEISTNFNLPKGGLTNNRSREARPLSLTVRVYGVWWDVRDFARYTLPYFIKNDPRTAAISGLLLVGLVAVIFRSLQGTRKLVPDHGPDSARDSKTVELGEPKDSLGAPSPQAPQYKPQHVAGPPT